MEKKDFHYIYFIENHLKDKDFKISLEKEDDKVKDLTKVFSGTFKESNQDEEYEYSIFQFKIFPAPKDKDFKIIIILDDGNNNF